MATFESPFAIGDPVKIDGCGELRAFITAVVWRNENPTCEVSWVEGSARTAWIETWRLEIDEGRRRG